MSDGGHTRLVAWDRELSAAHERLRDVFRRARESLDSGETVSARSEIRLYCQGYCVALGAHHSGEDDSLFPELSARYPALVPTIAKLTQDHEMIASLLGELEKVAESDARPDELERHLDGLHAIMESHFRYEERQLLQTLSGLVFDADPVIVLGTAGRGTNGRA